MAAKLKFSDLTADTPIPQANSQDVEFIYDLYQNAKRISGAYSIGFGGEEIMQQVLQEPANFVAASIRAGMLCSVYEDGCLAEWQTKLGLDRGVFAKAARYSLESGIGQFKIPEFLVFLRLAGM
jgi:hypothetical protein